MITLTDFAASKAKVAMQQRGHGIGLRLAVKTTGCSGLAYVLEFADDIKKDDIQFQEKDITIVVNSKDLTYLDGLEITYEKKGLSEGFQFINPNEIARCGCGESFTVKT